MTQSGSNFRIECNDERGVILELRDKRLTGTLSIREMQTFEELAEQFQVEARRETEAQQDTDLEL
jgi:hypothetical protein